MTADVKDVKVIRPVKIAAATIVGAIWLCSCAAKGDQLDRRYMKPDAVDAILHAPAFDRSRPYKTVTKVEAAADLRELERTVQTRQSYHFVTDFDYSAAISAMIADLPDTVPVPQLALQIHKLVQNLGDSHALVKDWVTVLPKRYAPAKYGIHQGRIFAYKPDNSALLDPEHPYVQSIDGLAIEHWFERAADIASGAGSSESSRFFRGRQALAYISFMRSELGLDDPDTVQYKLESADGASTISLTLPVLSELSDTGKPFGLPDESRILDGNIGYLRIYAQRGEALVNSIAPLMGSMHDTRALIIDARQCGGGRRRNLQALFPFFMAQDDPPYIPNVARLRIPADALDFDPVGKLKVGDKNLKYISGPDVTEGERRALTEFLAEFTPSVSVPDNAFTDWYFMALQAEQDKRHYDKPVYLLVDFGVGSAGDIFVSAFKGWRNVTLVGTPSNGRSGNSRVTKLSNSQIDVNLSTMISYQKTGELYDWVGIQPDIYMEPAISDWLEQTDTILERVVTMIEEG